MTNGGGCCRRAFIKAMLSASNIAAQSITMDAVSTLIMVVCVPFYSYWTASQWDTTLAMNLSLVGNGSKSFPKIWRFA